MTGRSPVRLLTAPPLRRGDRERAIRRTRTYLRVRKHDAEAWIILGVLESEVGGNGSEERVLRQGLAINPVSVGLACSLGDCLVAQSRIDEAIQVVGQALQDHPEDPLPHVFLARRAAEEHRWADATTHAGQAAERLRADDTYARMMLTAAVIYIPGQRDLTERIVNDWHRVDPRDPRANLVMAVLDIGVDERRSQKRLKQARRRWQGSQVEFEREFHLFRRLLAKGAPPIPDA